METPLSSSGTGNDEQFEAFDRHYYGESDAECWDYHRTADPYTRFIADRRMKRALKLLGRRFDPDPATESILVTCGGVGGEGTFLADTGWANVTVSDFSPESLQLCNEFDPRLATLQLDTQAMALPDDSFDYALVRDGLHHLGQPAAGLAEMLRVCRKGVIVIEPHYGWAGRRLGKEWEVNGEAVNYVFRWNAQMLEQVAKSFLVHRDVEVHVDRHWDHGLAVSRATSKLSQRRRLTAARTIYAVLRPLNRIGNMMVALVVKGNEPAKDQIVASGQPMSSHH